jgi:hypothetical protein
VGFPFVAFDKTVYRGQTRIAICFSGTMAKRIANALNKCVPDSRQAIGKG